MDQMYKTTRVGKTIVKSHDPADLEKDTKKRQRPEESTSRSLNKRPKICTESPQEKKTLKMTSKAACTVNENQCGNTVNTPGVPPQKSEKPKKASVKKVAPPLMKQARQALKVMKNQYRR